MSEIRLSIKLYLTALALAAVGSASFAMARTATPSRAQAVLALAFAALLAVAHLFPFQFAPKTKVTFGTALIFAAILILDPGVAAMVAGAGNLIAHTVRRRPWDEMLINGSESVLQAGVGGLILSAAGWDVGELRFDRPGQLGALALAAAAMHLVNNLTVATAAGLYSGLSPLGFLRRNFVLDGLERVVQLALGLLAAILVDARAWALPLLLLPACAVYASSERHVQLRRQSLEMQHRTLHDPLTDLPNRTLFLDRLERCLARMHRHQGCPAVLTLGLDRFDVVNDSLGHEAGDRLLVAVATRLRAHMRPQDTVARLDGDEFALLIEDVADAGHAARLAERITGCLGTPFAVEGRDVFLAASIGISLATPGRQSADDLLRDARAAMCRARNGGEARYQVFDESMHTRALERLELENELRQAAERGQLVLYYQPVVELAAGRITGLEALVRWEHPSRGLVSPAEFIPLAEETGLILTIGRWVLEEACRQARVWRERYPARAPVVVAVNLSVRQFRHPDLVDEIARTLRDMSLDPGLLMLEITESVVMEDAQANAGTLRRLRELGVRLAIDDFGTGYSSLSYLKSFPVDTLKIDRSFVGGLGRDREDEAIVGAVVTLARALGLRLTAEGVECAEQLRRLRALGCDLAQGYYFARPLPSRAVELLLAEGLPAAQAAASPVGQRRA